MSSDTSLVPLLDPPNAPSNSIKHEYQLECGATSVKSEQLQPEPQGLPFIITVTSMFQIIVTVTGVIIFPPVCATRSNSEIWRSFVRFNSNLVFLQNSRTSKCEHFITKCSYQINANCLTGNLRKKQTCLQNLCSCNIAQEKQPRKIL